MKRDEKVLSFQSILHPFIYRKELADNYSEEFLREQLSTYSKFDLDYESSVVLKNMNL